MRQQSVRIKRNASTEELIEYHLQNYREPNAYREMADALESFRGPRPWAKVLNRLSKKHDPRKMQQRHFSVAEVDRLLQVLCGLRVQGEICAPCARRGRNQAREQRN